MHLAFWICVEGDTVVNIAIKKIQNIARSGADITNLTQVGHFTQNHIRIRPIGYKKRSNTTVIMDFASSETDSFFLFAIS